jgi:hypothetical protein
MKSKSCPNSGPGLLRGLVLAAILLLSLAGFYPVSAAGQPFHITVTRSLPAFSAPGLSFGVKLTFSAPGDELNAIGLSDFAPAGWTIALDNNWNTPGSDLKHTGGNRADYIWNGPFENGTSFSAVYRLSVPSDAQPGTYYFFNESPSPQIEYYVAGAGPYFDDIGGLDAITIGAPTIEAISPASGKTAGGTTVTLSGSGFIENSTAVSFGGASASAVKVMSGTLLTAITPAGKAGARDVVVATPAGTATLPGGFNYKSSSTGGGGGGGGSPAPRITLNGFQSASSLTVSSSGILELSARLQSSDSRLILDINPGTRLLNSSGSVLTALGLTSLTAPAAPAPDQTILLAYTLTPNGARVDPFLNLTMAFNASALPAGVATQDLYLAYYDGALWQKLNTTFNPDYGTFTAQISHFSDFALIARVVPAAPAASPLATSTTGAAATPSTPPATASAIPTGTVTATLKPSTTAVTTAPTAVNPPAATTATPLAALPQSSHLTGVETTGRSPSQSSFPWTIIIVIAAGLVVVLVIVLLLRGRPNRIH